MWHTYARLVWTTIVVFLKCFRCNEKPRLNPLLLNEFVHFPGKINKNSSILTGTQTMPVLSPEVKWGGGIAWG
jgi:hypothetical protein